MSIDTITRAIDLARGLSWFEDYTRWATAWLDGSDRSRESAARAFNRVRQWTNFGGQSWAARCLSCAATAAVELDRGEVVEALESARLALRCEEFDRDPPPERDRSGEQPGLIFDDWNRDSGGAKRGRSYDPREV
jgi:hypothetical protein